MSEQNKHTTPHKVLEYLKNLGIFTAILLAGNSLFIFLLGLVNIPWYLTTACFTAAFMTVCISQVVLNSITALNTNTVILLDSVCSRLDNLVKINYLLLSEKTKEQVFPQSDEEGEEIVH